jgi:hypothetical protein
MTRGMGLQLRNGTSYSPRISLEIDCGQSVSTAISILRCLIQPSLLTVQPGKNLTKTAKQTSGNYQPHLVAPNRARGTSDTVSVES